MISEEGFKTLLANQERARQSTVEATAAIGALSTVMKRLRVGNKWEREYGQYLDTQVAAGAIASWGFERYTLRLADGCRYTPDFYTFSPATGCIAFHEVKGHWRDDALVKFKVAAEMYPQHMFLAVRKRKVREGGGWEVIRELNA